MVNYPRSLCLCFIFNPITTSPTRPCQNPNPFESCTAPGKPSLGWGGCTFYEFPCDEPWASPVLQYKLLCQVSDCQNKASAVFLDRTTWLQVVKSQNSSPPLLQDPPEKERPLLSKSGDIRNVGEAKNKEIKNVVCQKVVKCFHG